MNLLVKRLHIKERHILLFQLVSVWIFQFILRFALLLFKWISVWIIWVVWSSKGFVSVSFSESVLNQGIIWWISQILWSKPWFGSLCRSKIRSSIIQQISFWVSESFWWIKTSHSVNQLSLWVQWIQLELNLFELRLTFFPPRGISNVTQFVRIYSSPTSPSKKATCNTKYFISTVSLNNMQSFQLPEILPHAAFFRWFGVVIVRPRQFAVIFISLI